MALDLTKSILPASITNNTPLSLPSFNRNTPAPTPAPTVAPFIGPIKPATPVATKPAIPTTSSTTSNQSGYINGVSPAEYARLDNFYKTPTATPSPSVGSTINSANTQTPPAVNLPSTNVPTQGATLSSDINTQAQNYANSIVNANELATSKTNLDTTAKSIADYISGRSGETALRDAEYQANVDPAKQELNDITNQLNQETLAGRRRIEAVLNIPGITKEQAQDKINEIDRVNVSKQADLAIIFQAKNGAYETAKEIADRKVSAFLEVEKNKLDALQFTYTNNKELFNKQEQRQFETAQAERTRLLNEKSTELKAINDLALSALESGAPTSVVQKMQNAKTQAEAIALGGQYVGALDRQVKQAQLEQSKASTAKIYQDIAESRATAEAKKANLVLTPTKAVAIQNDIQETKDLASSNGIKSAVGTSFLSRATSGVTGFLGKALSIAGIPGLFVDTKQKLTGENQNFIAGVEKLRSQITLDSLANAKANGITFGSLTEGERQEVGKSGALISSWVITDDNGKVVGYNTSEKAMRDELDKVNNYKALDYIYRGGNPLDVGASVMPNGDIVVTNSDGTFSIINSTR